MEKRLKDFKMSLGQKINLALSDIDIIISPLNVIKTIKIIELDYICEFISYSKDNNNLYLELKEYLHKNKTLILNSSEICPGVDTTYLNTMTLELLSDELTEDEKMQLASNIPHLKDNKRVLRRAK